MTYAHNCCPIHHPCHLEHRMSRSYLQRTRLGAAAAWGLTLHGLSITSLISTGFILRWADLVGFNRPSHIQACIYRKTPSAPLGHLTTLSLSFSSFSQTAHTSTINPTFPHHYALCKPHCPSVADSGYPLPGLRNPPPIKHRSPTPQNSKDSISFNQPGNDTYLTDDSNNTPRVNAATRMSSEQGEKQSTVTGTDAGDMEAKEDFLHMGRLESNPKEKRKVRMAACSQAIYTDTLYSGLIETQAREEARFQEGPRDGGSQTKSSGPFESRNPTNPNSRGGGPYQAPKEAMSLLAWNCRGVRGEPIVRALRLLARKHRPSMIFLSETKANSEHCNKIARHCNLNGIFTVESSNAAGGLCLLWNTELKEAWTCDRSSNEVVKNAWNNIVNGSKAFQLSSKLKNVKTGLRRWNKEVFGYYDTNIAGIMEKLEEIQRQHPTAEINEQEEKLIAELEENLTKKDLIWRQKSRELWLKEGDRNSKFFHLSIVIRRRSNHIAAIKDNDREWIQDHEGIGNYFLRNFQELFNTSNPTIPKDMEDLINHTITEPENECLT
ncbi:hypothetical protein CRG98_020069 [Punica granatum]|uniref:Endonuclease/exonuclease/phosphatase domain-containing protein n=1 Tax=Punica granatum TaxID=22663 RepID=A0A2I0JTE8_PUNGR|nr:hypothetical protein CRG98_020069 [Punica granatum]